MIYLFSGAVWVLSPFMARSSASISAWVSMNLLRARSALSRSKGAASTFACTSLSTIIRSRALCSVSSRSFIWASFALDRNTRTNFAGQNCNHRLARQTGSLAMACATTDTAAAIAAQAAQGDCPRMSGMNLSTLP
jgi:hypothetical protein